MSTSVHSGHASAAFERGSVLTDCAIAIFVSSLLVGSIATPLQTRVNESKKDQTLELLENARAALLGYVSARGYLPCPANDASSGAEPAGTDHASGICPTYFGFLPAATLGVGNVDSQGYAVDAWGGAANRLRYAVSSQAVGSAVNTRAFTRTNGLRAAGVTNLSDPALSLFHVCASAAGIVPATSCGAALTLVSTAPAVIWSVGANGASGGSSGDEAQNPNPNGGSADRIFVSRVASNVAGSEYDDLVTWIPMPVLLTRLLAAGQLP